MPTNWNKPKRNALRNQIFDLLDEGYTQQQVGDMLDLAQCTISDCWRSLNAPLKIWLTKPQQKQINKLVKKGYCGAEISREVFGDNSMTHRSTIYRYCKRHKLTVVDGRSKGSGSQKTTMTKAQEAKAMKLAPTHCVSEIARDIFGEATPNTRSKIIHFFYRSNIKPILKKGGFSGSLAKHRGILANRA